MKLIAQSNLMTRNVLVRNFSFSRTRLLVAVGYMDPGNWITSMQGGAQFGYTLLFVILISSLSQCCYKV